MAVRSTKCSVRGGGGLVPGTLADRVLPNKPSTFAEKDTAPRRCGTTAAAAWAAAPSAPAGAVRPPRTNAAADAAKETSAALKSAAHEADGSGVSDCCAAGDPVGETEGDATGLALGEALGLVVGLADISGLHGLSNSSL